MASLDSMLAAQSPILKEVMRQAQVTQAPIGIQPAMYALPLLGSGWLWLSDYSWYLGSTEQLLQRLHQ